MGALAGIVFYCSISNIKTQDTIYEGTWEQVEPVYKQMLVDHPFPYFQLYCHI